jgi:predicted transcriptional regulator
MAMTLRLSDEETNALRERADHEGRSMQDIAREAVREYIDNRTRRERLNDVLDEQLPRYADALKRLGQ